MLNVEENRVHRLTSLRLAVAMLDLKIQIRSSVSRSIASDMETLSILRR
jgi:hypothetical protein